MSNARYSLSFATGEQIPLSSVTSMIAMPVRGWGKSRMTAPVSSAAVTVMQLTTKGGLEMTKNGSCAVLTTEQSGD